MTYQFMYQRILNIVNISAKDRYCVSHFVNDDTVYDLEAFRLVVLCWLTLDFHDVVSSVRYET